MIIKIARKEFTEMWRDGRFRWSAIIVLAPLVAALTIGPGRIISCRASTGRKI